MLSCPTACGIFPDQGLNPCPLHWQVESQPLDHQGSPSSCLSLKTYEEVSPTGLSFSTLVLFLKNEDAQQEEPY